MRMTLKCMSALLGYPSPELQAAAGEIRARLAREGRLAGATLAALDPLLAHLASADLLDLQSEYSELFDGSGALSLHLFEHVHGESRNRGEALVHLRQQYLARGFDLAANELPDYLPLFLEFLSFLAPDDARDWLGQPAHVFVALEERLAQRKSPYAAVFLALRVLPKAEVDAAALAAVRARMNEDEARPPDERWQEAPVTFTAAPASEVRTIGLSGRIRAMLGR